MDIITGWGQIRENIKCRKNFPFILKTIRRRGKVTDKQCGKGNQNLQSFQDKHQFHQRNNIVMIT